MGTANHAERRREVAVDVTQPPEANGAWRPEDVALLVVRLFGLYCLLKAAIVIPAMVTNAMWTASAYDLMELLAGGVSRTEPTAGIQVMRGSSVVAFLKALLAALVYLPIGIYCLRGGKRLLRIVLR